jgi:hypothetical protein
MASPVTHIIFALKILCLLPASIDKTEFIIGTSFPDIRYLAHIDRAATHIEPITWQDIITCQDSFYAGMLFHNLLDLIRLHHFEFRFYEREAPFIPLYKKMFPLVMKFAEDAILYETCDEWQKIANCFDTICDQEVEMCGNKEVVIQWHQALKNYLKEPPTVETIHAFLQATGGAHFQPNPDDYPVNKTFNDLCTLGEFRTVLTRFYDNFECFLTDELLTLPSFEPNMGFIPGRMQLAY